MIRKIVEEFVEFLSEQDSGLARELNAVDALFGLDVLIEEFCQTQVTTKLIEVDPDKKYIIVAPYLPRILFDETAEKLVQWQEGTAKYLLLNGVEIICLGRKDE